MYPVFGTTSKIPFSTFHFAGLPSLCAHFDRSLPSKRTTASDGGRPGESCVFDVPGSITAGSGRFGSWIFHFGSICASQTAGRTASSKAPIAEKRPFRIRVHLCKEQVGFYSGFGGKASAIPRQPQKQDL